MDLNEIATETGMRSWTSDQRDTVFNDINEIQQIALIVKTCIAGQAIDGDKPFSAKRRANKVNRQFKQVIRHLTKAAAGFEAINATHRREIAELPSRRTKAVEKKERRAQLRALTRQNAHALVQRTIAEGAQGLAADPRLAGQAMPQSQPQPVYVHPQAPSIPQSTRAPIPNFDELFKGVG
ncbi:hypothetical protein [Streptomyces sp. NPDC055105]|uniref:hypothetical protein n=1 Tax=Streptomyces sp. NPDC055105 TaxID=3365719 RepID=UPI0037CD439D